MPINPTPAAPPARAKKTPAARPAPVPHISRLQAREDALAGIGKISSLFLAMRGAYADAGAVAQHGPNISHEAAALAETDDRIASWIDYVTEAGPYMGLATAVGMLAMQIAANHGRIDASRFPAESGILPPDVLENRVKADMETTRLQFLQQAQASKQEAEKAARALADSMADHAQWSDQGLQARTPNGDIAFSVRTGQN